MRLNEAQIKKIEDQFRKGREYGYNDLEMASHVNIPLPLECKTNAAFQVKFTQDQEYRFGSVWTHPLGTSVRLESVGGYRNTDKDSFFYDMMELSEENGILEFHWLSNPLCFPEFIKIPEPPECKTYRFQVFDNGWADGSVWIGCSNKSFTATIPYFDKFPNPMNKYEFWRTIQNRAAKDFHWIDECPALGPWHENKGKN